VPHFQLVTADGVVLGARELGRPDGDLDGRRLRPAASVPGVPDRDTSTTPAQRRVDAGAVER
jgi:hypothetical protein